MKARTCCFVVLALLMLFANLHFASAQTLERGAIRGTIYDVSKASIPGAKLTLTSTATGLKREFTTNENGAYAFEAVTPGQYTLVVDRKSVV